MEWEFVLLDRISQLHGPLQDTIMKGITFLGELGWIWFAFTLILLLQPKYRKQGILMLTTLIIGVILGNGLIKNLVARPRPFQQRAGIELLIKAPKEYSFPSGHTRSSFEAAFAAFSISRKAGIISVVLAVLISFSRLFFYVHFPTDVLGGICLAAVDYFLAVKLISFVGNRKENRKEN